MKALVLAGGRGHRLCGATAREPKPLSRVASSRLLDFSLRSALSAGVDEILIVVSEFTEAIRELYGDRHGGLPLRYVTQQEPQGLVHAIECARDALAGDDFLLLLADEMTIAPRVAGMIETFERNEAFAVLGVARAAERALVRDTYAVLTSDEQQRTQPFVSSGSVEIPGTLRVRRLVEKPHDPPNDVMGTGNCVFRNEILSYAERCPIHAARGERELPDLVQCAIDDGRRVEAYELTEHYVNVNTPADLVRACELLRRHGGAS